jgi:hypothetical protein
MNEMNDKRDGDEKPISRTDGQNASAAATAQTMDIEDEKERAIAKAALSIAELGVCPCERRLISTER